MVTFLTSNQGDVGSNPIRGNMFFFQMYTTYILYISYMSMH